MVAPIPWRAVLAISISLIVPAKCLAGAPETPRGKDQLWSLQPVNRPELPDVADPHWPRSEIDYFIRARLDAAKLSPVRDAGPRTLVRRVYFDLIGLPPSPEEIRAYLADSRPDRFERLVNRLLASPQFGERWGRHWLDVVRFAESSGKEFNFSYPHAWPYRNYVIDSLNADKPYDQFVRQQLAGDLIHGNRHPEEQIDELIIATGFLALGPKRHNNGGRGFRADMVDELIDVTTRSVLGLTVACARCHDHKFDPISSRDYYALAGIFGSTSPLYGTIKQKYSRHPSDIVPIGPNAHAKHAAAEAHEAKLSEATGKRTAKQEKLKKAEAELKAASKAANDPPSDAAQAAEASAPAEQEREVAELEEEVAALQSEVAKLEKTVKHLKATRPPRPNYTVSARDQEKPANAKIAIGGNPGNLGDEVPRGYLSCLDVDSAPAPDAEQSGRLELSRWLTSTDNPLTARVMVNRIWRHLFGAGLVNTVDNFGQLGSSPSHPKLLDWLAAEFMAEDWSIKHTIRKIVLSRTYRLSSTRDERGIAVDPANVLLWRMAPRRLEAEAIRDSLLAVSDQLDLARPKGSPVTGLGDRLVRDVALEKLQPPSNHRSVYLPVVRDYPPTLFELFDFPSPDLVSGNRVATTGPLQDLYLRNDKQMHQHAQAAAELLLASAPDDQARVKLAFERAFGRPPSAEEQAAALALVEDIPAATDRADAEKKNGSPQTQAWESLCLALFGSAEFRYLVDID